MKARLHIYNPHMWPWCVGVHSCTDDLTFAHLRSRGNCLPPWLVPASVNSDRKNKRCSMLGCARERTGTFAVTVWLDDIMLCSLEKYSWQALSRFHKKMQLLKSSVKNPTLMAAAGARFNVTRMAVNSEFHAWCSRVKSTCTSFTSTYHVTYTIYGLCHVPWKVCGLCQSMLSVHTHQLMTTPNCLHAHLSSLHPYPVLVSTHVKCVQPVASAALSLALRISLISSSCASALCKLLNARWLESSPSDLQN